MSTDGAMGSCLDKAFSKGLSLVSGPNHSPRFIMGKGSVAIKGNLLEKLVYLKPSFTFTNSK